MTADTVAVAPTSHLVITKGVSNTMTLRAGELVIVQQDMSGTHDLGGEVQVREKGLHLASREHEGVQWRGPVLVT